MAGMVTRERQALSFVEKQAFLMEVYGDPLSCYDFYREVFPKGFLQDAYRINPNAPHDGNYISIANALHEAKRDGHIYRKNHYVTDDLSALSKLKHQVAFVSPCAYLGGAKDLKHLRYVCALVVDLDYVDIPQIKDLEHQIDIGYLPRPTLIVNSGTGLHLYYVFNEPMKVWPEQQQGYSALKHALIDLCWNEYTSQGAERQYSGIVQPYRIIGSRTKLDCDPHTEKVISQDYAVFGWKSGDRWTLDELLDFKPSLDAGLGRFESNIMRAKEILRPEENAEHLTLEKAKELYPNWYVRRILHNEPPKTIEQYKWHINPRVYEWWLRRIRSEAVVGHRYHCILMLAVYAVKCDVPFDKLKADAFSLLEPFEDMTNDESNHFKQSDIDQALHAYKNKNYATLPITSIEYFSGLRIDKNHRSGHIKNQVEHLEEARAIRDIRQKRKGKNWYDGGGRPKGSKNRQHPKADLIRAYAAEHPTANHSEIAKALGVSRPTVIKWLKQ